MDTSKLDIASAPRPAISTDDSEVVRHVAPLDGADPVRMVALFEGLASQWVSVADAVNEVHPRGSGALRAQIPHELLSSLVYWRRRLLSSDPSFHAVIKLKWAPPPPDLPGLPGTWLYAIHVDGVRAIGGTSFGSDKARATQRATQAAVDAGILAWAFED
ncbi:MULTISPECIES: hypothetical protein [Achromobacter]|uniref:hypothetical protein n=1 Tax=Achromobacter TaxID=222 RepID=UPI000CEB71D6|nr:MULTISPECIES: hypothetical protein [Achromobacter]AVG43915.1 hypothetical protein MC81_30890 [Achromobacter insolitus]